MERLLTPAAAFRLGCSEFPHFQHRICASTPEPRGSDSAKSWGNIQDGEISTINTVLLYYRSANFVERPASDKLACVTELEANMDAPVEEKSRSGQTEVAVVTDRPDHEGRHHLVHGLVDPIHLFKGKWLIYRHCM